MTAFPDASPITVAAPVAASSPDLWPGSTLLMKKNPAPQPPIEDYAFLSDLQTGALLSREGSIDWFCSPRFDSPSCFAALVGTPQNGRWLLQPVGQVIRRRRRYRPDTLILETEIETASGVVRMIDFMPPRGDQPDIIRIVEGVRGRVRLKMELTIRFDYGQVVPWVRKRDGNMEAVGGPDALVLRTPVKTRGKALSTVAEFTVSKGRRVPFVLTWFPSHQLAPRKVNPVQALRETERYWKKWVKTGHPGGEWREAVVRSLLTLKGLIYAPTGGMVAAATTSLPERMGGVRNWDYRYCWLRDAAFTLTALMGAGFRDEACAWREWLLRAVAGSPSQMQIMYGVRGERRLDEFELPWLRGYHRSTPVRVGNAASDQRQLDVYGELFESMYQAHRAGIKTNPADWRLQVALLEYLEENWQKKDYGLWEVRGVPVHFTHSKVMVWVAFDRAVRLIEECKCAGGGNLARWRRIRDRIHEQVCRRGYNSKLKAFTQSYGSTDLDASLLQLPLVGFLPPNDARVIGTIEAIQRKLMQNGLVLRYIRKRSRIDPLPGSEAAFLPCSFWLVDCLHLIGRTDEARRLFEHLLSLRNDLGLLSEEYDPRTKRQLGNFPQALTHVALVNSARLLNHRPGAAAKLRSNHR